MQHSNEYLFIVGQNRSGTSLLRNILNKSKDISLADENNYYGHILEYAGLRNKISNDLDNKQYHKIVDKIYVQEVYRNFFYKNSAYWKWFKATIGKQDFLKTLKENDFNEDQLFEYFIKIYNQKGAKIAGDKTPDNFRYTSNLYNLSNPVKFIHIIRNPKAVYSSEIVRRKAKNSKELSAFIGLIKKTGLLRIFFLINVSLQYRLSNYYARKNKKKYKDDYKVITFENLILNAEATLKDICCFLNIKFEENFLYPDKVRSYGKQNSRKGIDKNTVNKWQGNLSSTEKKIIDMLTTGT